MFQLTDHETDLVFSRLEAQGGRDTKLTRDLLDHFCCHMEQNMEQGADFEAAYTEAARDIAPNGIKEIEFELFFILNFNKQLSMKRFIFSAGFAASFLVSTGMMFRTMHWPGANIIMFLGFAVMLLTALSAAVHLVRFFSQRPASFWFRTITGIAAILLISVGCMFKTFSLPGANIMYALGTIVLNFFFLPAFFLQLYKTGLVKSNVMSNEM
jgi:hypothetical protein